MDYAQFERRAEAAAEALSRGRKVSLRASDIATWGVQPLLAEVKNHLGLIAWEDGLDAAHCGGERYTFKLRLETVAGGGGRLIAKKVWHE